MDAPRSPSPQTGHSANDRLTGTFRLDAAHDYEVNLKAEPEILSLHEELDELRELKWTELITLQQEQIRLLTQLKERP